MAKASCKEWPVLSEDEIKSKMGEGFKMWELKTDSRYTPKEVNPPGALVRSFTTKNFQAALDFIQAGGAVAESRGLHHLICPKYCHFHCHFRLLHYLIQFVFHL